MRSHWRVLSRKRSKITLSCYTENRIIGNGGRKEMDCSLDERWWGNLFKHKSRSYTCLHSLLYTTLIFLSDQPTLTVRHASPSVLLSTLPSWSRLSLHSHLYYMKIPQIIYSFLLIDIWVVFLWGDIINNGAMNIFVHDFWLPMCIYFHWGYS